MLKHCCAGWKWKYYKSCEASNHLLGLKSPLEETQERSKAEAVHVVDLRQVCDDKIHLAGTLCKRQVGIPLLKLKKKRGQRKKGEERNQQATYEKGRNGRDKSIKKTGRKSPKTVLV